MNNNINLHRAWGFMALLGLLLAAPGWSTTLVRAGLETLVDDHEMIVVGEVVDTYSYWNTDGSFILTDVTVMPERYLKGDAKKGPVTVTLMGGTVDDMTALIVAGAELVPGNSYLLFLDRGDLKAGQPVMTVREHCQGAFDISLSADGELRVISQANGMHLLQDAEGRVEPPGGKRGLPQPDIFQTIVDLVAQGAK